MFTIRPIVFVQILFADLLFEFGCREKYHIHAYTQIKTHTMQIHKRTHNGRQWIQRSNMIYIKMLLNRTIKNEIHWLWSELGKSLGHGTQILFHFIFYFCVYIRWCQQMASIAFLIWWALQVKKNNNYKNNNNKNNTNKLLCIFISFVRRKFVRFITWCTQNECTK